jgi:hypothetical protein
MENGLYHVTARGWERGVIVDSDIPLVLHASLDIACQRTRIEQSPQIDGQAKSLRPFIGAVACSCNQTRQGNSENITSRRAEKALIAH